MHACEEFYPPSFATLTVRDLSVSSRWYQQVMGFKTVFEMYGTHGQLILSHLRWSKYADLMLLPDESEPNRSEPKGAGITLTFMVVEHPVDELAKTASAHGADIVTNLVIRPWGTQEVVIADPDGYRLSFSQPAEAFRSIA